MRARHVLLALGALGASAAEAETALRCGLGADRIGADVAWHGVALDGYVERAASGGPSYVIVFSCRDSTGAALPGEDVFALRLADLAALPPTAQPSGQPQRNRALMAITGTIAAADTVRGASGRRVPIIQLHAARYALPADSVAAAGQQVRPPSDRAPPFLVIDEVPIGPMTDAMFSQRLLWLTVEQIEVLRGPAARDRFGDRAQSGAIIVRTTPQR